MIDCRVSYFEWGSHKVFKKFFCRPFVGLLSVIYLFLIATPSIAQHTPLQGAIGGASSASLEHNADDVLGRIVADHQNRRMAPGDQGVTTDAYAMGRLRTTDHDGYKATVLERSVDFEADEWSLFGALSYSFRGVQPGSFGTVSAFAGWTALDIELGDQPLAGIFNKAGSARNEALMFGLAGVYAVGTTYAAASIAGASGETDIKDKVNGFSPTYDTRGFILSALVGHSQAMGRVSNANIFAAIQGGLRYTDFAGDSYLSRTGLTTFKSEFQSTTVLLSGQLYGVLKSGGVTYRPYVLNMMQIDADYDHVALATDATGTEVTRLQRDRLLNKTELGLNIISGATSFSAAAFGEFADDRQTFGGRLGAKFRLN